MTHNLPPPGLGTPAAEFELDEAFVGALLAGQYPVLADLPLRHVDGGWDNAMFRLGERLAMRLPRRAAAAALIVREQNWLPRLAPALTLPIPVPLRNGIPARGYPWHWSVVPWLPGAPADLHLLPDEQAGAWAAFLRSLHQPAPPEAPANPYRGVPLQQRVAAAEERLERLERNTGLITPRLRQVWSQALDATPDAAPVWLHGDLHPGNILVHDGVPGGVIDWGDLTSGDRATDLASIWMLFDTPAARAAALEAYAGLTEQVVRRAKGWAIVFGILLLDTGLVDHPRHAAIGERTLRRVVALP